MVDERLTTLIVAPPGSEFVVQLARELERLGHDVVKAPDWQAALDAAADRPPDVVVLDPRVSTAAGPSQKSALAQLRVRRPDLIVIGLGGSAKAALTRGDP